MAKRKTSDTSKVSKPVEKPVEKPEVKKPVTFSKWITNIGVKPIILEENAYVGKIVLHPKKKIRYENKVADKYIKMYTCIKEVK